MDVESIAAVTKTVSLSSPIPGGPIDAHELCPPNGKHCGSLLPSMSVHSRHAWQGGADGEEGHGRGVGSKMVGSRLRLG